MKNIIDEKDLYPLPLSLKHLNEDGLNYLRSNGLHVCEIYAFKGRDRTRPIQLARILKDAIDINLGKVYEIEDSLAIELKRLLSAVCYLFNSTSFREGKYFVFDKMEVNNKIGRR